jgi:hypothetical protein
MFLIQKLHIILYETRYDITFQHDCIKTMASTISTMATSQPPQPNLLSASFIKAPPNTNMKNTANKMQNIMTKSIIIQVYFIFSCKDRRWLFQIVVQVGEIYGFSDGAQPVL